MKVISMIVIRLVASSKVLTNHCRVDGPLHVCALAPPLIVLNDSLVNNTKPLVGKILSPTAVGLVNIFQVYVQPLLQRLHLYRTLLLLTGESLPKFEDFLGTLPTCCEW